MRSLVLVVTLVAMSSVASAFEVLAETNNPENIRLNGESFQYCALVQKHGYTQFDKKPAVFIRVAIGNDRSDLMFIKLFRIDENGDYVNRWYYPNSDQIANQLSEREIDHGYRFESRPNKITYSNGEPLARDNFEIRLKNGNLKEAFYVEVNKGMGPLARFALALPSAIFGANTSGTDLTCRFDP